MARLNIYISIFFISTKIKLNIINLMVERANISSTCKIFLSYNKYITNTWTIHLSSEAIGYITRVPIRESMKHLAKTGEYESCHCILRTLTC